MCGSDDTSGSERVMKTQNRGGGAGVFIASSPSLRAPAPGPRRPQERPRRIRRRLREETWREAMRQIRGGPPAGAGARAQRPLPTRAAPVPCGGSWPPPARRGTCTPAARPPSPPWRRDAPGPAPGSSHGPPPPPRRRPPARLCRRPAAPVRPTHTPCPALPAAPPLPPAASRKAVLKSG